MRVVTLARKPLVGSVVENVVDVGAGALDIEATRIGVGRYPANVFLIGSEVIAAVAEQSGPRPGMAGRRLLRRGSYTGTSIGGHGIYNTSFAHNAQAGYDDDGDATRFFKCIPQPEATALPCPQLRDGEPKATGRHYPIIVKDA